MPDGIDDPAGEEFRRRFGSMEELRRGLAKNAAIASMRSNSGRLALVGAGLALSLAVAGCGSSHVSSSPRPQVTTVTSPPPSRGGLASICDRTEYELNVIYQHTVGGEGPKEFKQRLSKLATQSLPVIESALIEVKSMKGPRAARDKADLQSSRGQLLLLEHTIAQTQSDDYGGFPRGTLANLWRVIVGCAHSRKPISG